MVSLPPGLSASCRLCIDVLAARRIVARECLSKALPIERARGFRLHPRKKADRGRAERAPGSSQAPSRDEVSRPGVARESLARCVAREARALAPFATRSAHRGARPRRVCPNATLTPPSTHPPAIIKPVRPCQLHGMWRDAKSNDQSTQGRRGRTREPRKPRSGNARSDVTRRKKRGKPSFLRPPAPRGTTTREQRGNFAPSRRQTCTRTDARRPGYLLASSFGG